MFLRRTVSLAPLTRAAGTHNGKERRGGRKRRQRHRAWNVEQLSSWEGTHRVHPGRQQAGGGPRLSKSPELRGQDREAVMVQLKGPVQGE